MTGVCCAHQDRIAVDVGAVTLVSLGVLVYEVQQVDELVELGLVDGTGLVSRHGLSKEACPHSPGKLPCVSRSAAISEQWEVRFWHGSRHNEGTGGRRGLERPLRQPVLSGPAGTL